MTANEVSLQGHGAAGTPDDDEQLILALRGGSEAAFCALVERYHTQLTRLALLYVPDRAAAEDVAQETWMGVLRGLERFEARSSLKTWIFRILVNRARTRGSRDARTIPFSSVWRQEDDPFEPAVEPDRFLSQNHEKWPGHWASRLSGWGDAPEERMLAQETRALIHRTIDGLAPSQREVMTLRDIEGWSAAEVCEALSISEANQRVLLHRARSKVRRALEQYLGER